MISHTNCILTGDFNVNLLKHVKSLGGSKFLENFLSHNFMSQIKIIATVIDNILINNNILNCISGNMTTSISDQLPQFIVLDSVLGTSTDEDNSHIFYWSFKNFHKEDYSTQMTLTKLDFHYRKQWLQFRIWNSPMSHW